MKKSMLILFFSLHMVSAIAQTNKAVVLENNFCSPILDSKRYLSKDFSMEYPRQARFECTYQCKANGKIDTVVAITTMTVRSSSDDAMNVVCQGVMVKAVPWGYDFDRVQPFYAYNTKLLELKRWAFENVSLSSKNNPAELANLQKLKTELNQVSSAYIMAGINGGTSTAYFLEAGKKLSAIAEQLPEKTTLLDETIGQITVNRGAGKLAASSESLVFGSISTLAGWRVPNHLF